MPLDYQKDLFFGRQNLCSLYECLEKLAFMGLVSFQSVPKSAQNPDIFHVYGPGLSKGNFWLFSLNNFLHLLFRLLFFKPFFHFQSSIFLFQISIFFSKFWFLLKSLNFQEKHGNLEMRNPLETISFCSKFILLIFLFFILLFRLKFPFLIFFYF